MRSLRSYDYQAIIYHAVRKLMIPVRAAAWVLLKGLSLVLMCVVMTLEWLAEKVIPPVLVAPFTELGELMEKYDGRGMLQEDAQPIPEHWRKIL